MFGVIVDERERGFAGDDPDELTEVTRAQLQRYGISTLIELAPAMAAHLAPGGYVILSGLLVVQAEAVIGAYAASGICLVQRNDLGEWSALTMQRK